MVEIKIDPVTRLEGHLGVTVNVENGVVKDARTHGTMFRGFERILVGRDPRDAPAITQRICGVCHVDHRLVSLRAIEKAAGVTPPDGAVKLRNIIEAIQTIYSHALSIYALTGPDYSDAVAKTGLTRFNFLTGGGYMEAVENQRKLHECLAVLGGKVPHHMTTCPGGATLIPSVEAILRVKTKLLEVSEWVGATENVPAVIDSVTKGKFDASLGSALHDIVALVVTAKGMGADTWGVGPNKFLAYGVYDMPGGKLFEPAGFYDGNKVGALDEKKIVEYVKHSWYTDASGGMYVGNAPPPQDSYGKAGAYSWAKSPRYDGNAAEVGPLARLVVAGLDPFDLRKALAGGAAKASALARIIARAQETLVLRDAVVKWLDELKPGEKVYTPYAVPSSGFGVGFWEAPRGALGHWVNIKDKKIDRYQVITPTAWNVGPTDDGGQKGPIEQALIGVPVPDAKNPINVLRAVRSFDPCLACTVHVLMPNGKKYSIEVMH